MPTIPIIKLPVSTPF